MYKRMTGQVLYTSDKAGRQGIERGREFFTITTSSDGHRTLEAHCEIDDEPSVLRHVTVSLDPMWRVLDAFVRISVNDRFAGSSWFKFTKAAAYCEAWTAKEGRLSQALEIDQPLDGFGTHPIQGDAWLCHAYPLEKGPGTYTLNIMLSSTHHRGATGPYLHPVKHELKYAGRENIKVAAGAFSAHHFIFGQEGNWADDDPLKHPVYHLWCTADDDFVVLRARAEGYMQSSYELVSLEVSS